MELKTLSLELGKFVALQEGEPPVAGWYIDPVTGQRIFYDPETHNFYTMAGGVFIPLGYMNPAPKQVAVAPGDNLKITVSFKYTGPAVTGACIRYCVGVYGAFGFSEQLAAVESFNIPQVVTTPSSPNVTNYHTFAIPANAGTNWTSIYAKLYGGTPSLGGEVSPSYIFGYSLLASSRTSPSSRLPTS